MLVHRRAKHRGRHAADGDVEHRHDAGRAWLVIDRGELAKEFAGLDLAQQHLAAARLDDHPHGAGDDEEDVVARILVVEQPLAGGRALPRALAIELFDRRGRQRAK